MNIRKQVYELTAEDFETTPVWEFALDEEGETGQDEATVRPVALEETLDPSDGMFVVRAVFTLADGSEMPGYLTPPLGGDESLGTIQPIVLTSQGQVGFWHGLMAPSPDISGLTINALVNTSMRRSPFASGPRLRSKAGQSKEISTGSCTSRSSVCLGSNLDL